MDLTKTFKRTVKDFGDHCAVESENLRLTYLTLNCWATSLSHVLKARSEGNPFIVIDLGISTEHVVASLAIRFISKIITVIHETYTEEQFLKCLSKLEYPLIVTTTQRWVRYSKSNYTNVIFLDSLNLDSESTVSSISANAENEEYDGICHCLFTSGSTGEPKAVLIKEAPLIIHIKDSVSTFKDVFKSGFRQSACYSVSFIPSIMETWRPLCLGGTIVIPPSSVRIDIEKFKDWISMKSIEVIGLVTPIAEIFLSKNLKALTSLKLVIIGGARLNETKLNLKDASFECLNAYGSTEFYFICWNRIPKGSTKVSSSVGFPHPNVKVYIFDENGILVKDKFVHGEIYATGPTIFKGYVGDKEKTAKVLRVLPNYEELGVLYRTGDIGYFGEDGSLFVVGRKDSQIKIYGIRLELGEVEAALTSYPPIQQAVVAPKETNGLIQLIAFCTITDHYKQKKPQVEEIYDFLETKLQPHAVPALIVFKDSFPTLASGKVDRVKVKEEALTAANAEKKNNSIPLDPIFVGARKIWASLLKVSEEEITLDQHFFRTGGNSLLAVEFLKEVAKLLEDLNVSAPPIGIQTMFTNPTLSKFVAYLHHGTVSPTFVETVDFEKETILPIDILNMSNVSSTEMNADVKGILLTGVTGYLGPFLLKELLKQCSKDVSIYCIIRASSDEEALERVQKRFSELRLEFSEDKQIKYIQGNLAALKFGLDDEKYNFLSNQIGQIIHLAADVNFAKSYEDIKHTTVAMTLNVLRFALNVRRKRIEFMSSIGVFDGTIDENIYKNMDYVAKEEILPDGIINPARMKNSYFQSKWVSEKLLINANENMNIPIGIYRIAQIGAHLETGSVNTNDAIAGFLIVSHIMGKYPDISIHLPFVDANCAREIAILCSDLSNELRHFHIVGGYTGIDDLLDWNRSIKKIPLREWIDEFDKFKKITNVESTIIFLASLFIHGMKNEKTSIGRSIHKDIKFDRTITLKTIERKASVKNSVLTASPKYYVEALLSNQLKLRN